MALLVSKKENRITRIEQLIERTDISILVVDQSASHKYLKDVSIHTIIKSKCLTIYL